MQNMIRCRRYYVERKMYYRKNINRVHRNQVGKLKSRTATKTLLAILAFIVDYRYRRLFLKLVCTYPKRKMNTFFLLPQTILCCLSLWKCVENLLLREDNCHLKGENILFSFYRKTISPTICMNEQFYTLK